MGTPFDMALLTRAMFCEVVNPKYWARFHGDPPKHLFHAISVTDHRGLYDLLIKEGQLTGVIEKRLCVDLAGIVDMIECQGEERDRRETLKWTPTWAMWADHLTKHRPGHELRSLLAARAIKLQAMTNPMS